MKQFFTLLVLFTISLGLYAGAIRTRLTISTTGNLPVRVMVDGIAYNAAGYNNNENEILVNNLRPGFHNIKVYAQRGRYNRPKTFTGNSNVIYEGRVFIRAQYHVDITINRFGKALLDERMMNSGYYDEYNGDDWEEDISRAMTSRNFDQFKTTLAAESFDNSRLVIAKQTIAANFFTASQVKELVQLFTYEASRLEVAKFAYMYTLDKGNYFLVNDAFTYSTSKEELARYIQQRR